MFLSCKERGHVQFARRRLPEAAFFAGLLLLVFEWPMAFAESANGGVSQVQLAEKQIRALTSASREVQALKDLVHKQGLVPRFGFIADKIIKRGLRIAGEKPGSGLEKALDAPLQALFREQLHTLSARAADRYEESMAAKPNPVEARRAAEDCFVQGAEGLMRPHSDWSYEDELRDLVLRIADSSGQDMQLIQEQGKQGQGKHVTLEVIRKLQQQSEAVQREVETRGAFPWKVNWQYFIESSPVGFRGQYNQGRSIVELLLLPSPDPRLKKNLLNRIGPLNLAVAFDMLL